MDGAVGERRRERVVDEPVLLDEGEPREARALDRHLEVVAAAGAVGDGEVVRVRERRAEQRFEAIGVRRRAQLRLTSLKKRLSSPPAVSSW